MISRLKAGVAELDITGRVGLELAAELNPRVSQAVRTPLMAKALVLSDGPVTLAIVALDLLGLQAETAGKLVAAISDRTGIDPDAVMVICSRTRGAPYTTPVVGWPGVDETYLAELVTTVPSVVAQAKDQLVDAAIGVGRAVLPHLVYNHRLMTRNLKAISAWMGVPKNEVLEPEGPIDPEFSVLVVRDMDGRPFCLLWNFAADDRFAVDDQVSASLSAFVQQEVDERIGRHVPCIVLPGCAGNVSYVYGLDETQDAVASAVMAVQLETPCDPMVKLGYACERMILPIRDYTQFWSRADVELKAPDAVDAFAHEVELMQQENAQAVPSSVQVFRMGMWSLVGLPGMPFVEFAQAIKRESPFRSTLVAACCGGDVGTVITREAFDHEGFEAWPARSARIGPGGGEFIAEQALRLLNELRGTRGG